MFGPFVGETDARAYALDLADEEEGLDLVEAMQMEHHVAQGLATGVVFWPYQTGEES